MYTYAIRYNNDVYYVHCPDLVSAYNVFSDVVGDVVLPSTGEWIDSQQGKLVIEVVKGKSMLLWFNKKIPVVSASNDLLVWKEVA